MGHNPGYIDWLCKNIHYFDDVRRVKGFLEYKSYAGAINKNWCAIDSIGFLLGMSGVKILESKWRLFGCRWLREIPLTRKGDTVWDTLNNIGKELVVAIEDCYKGTPSKKTIDKVVKKVDIAFWRRSIDFNDDLVWWLMCNHRGFNKVEASEFVWRFHKRQLKLCVFGEKSFTTHKQESKLIRDHFSVEINKATKKIDRKDRRKDGE